MTTVYNTKKQRRSLFLQSMKSTCIMAILAFLCFSFITFLDSSSYLYMDKIQQTAQFWDTLICSGELFLVNVAFILAGVMNAMLLFSFARSKKQCNVIFSLGMRRNDIYIPKVLGGLVPMLAAIMLGAVLEMSITAAFGYEINARYIVLVIMCILQFFLTYALSFLLSSAVMSNCGNIVEGVIFTGLLGISTLSLGNFFAHTFWEYTLGANFTDTMPLGLYADIFEPQALNNTTATWNWDNPFFIFSNLNKELLESYFDIGNTSYPSIYDWSGFISAGIYSVIAFVLGLIGFNRRKNEIAGTWGRAKHLNEAICILVGFYGIRVLTFLLPIKHGDGTFWSYLVGCASFILLYIIAKLIFSNKRKTVFKASLKRVPVYLAAYGAICLAFSLGLFGYSSNVPEASEIEYVTVNSPAYKYMDEKLSSSSHFGLKAQNLNQSSIYNPDLEYSGYLLQNNTMQDVKFTSESDIAKVLELHKAVIDDGKISNSGSNSCATALTFTYKLKNGKIITRLYTETTEETVLKLTSLNETDAVRLKLAQDYFVTEEAFELIRSYVEKEEMTGEDYSTLNKSDYLINQQCFIFPKDMSRGYNIGLIDKELYSAIVKDALVLSSKQYFEHSPADEIGVLSFGLSASEFAAYGYGENVEIYTDYYYADSEMSSFTSEEGMYAQTSWNLNSGDIKSVVITKDMVNTVKYLEEHDMMKYFENSRDLNDINYIKLAKPGELYGEGKKSYNYPIFYSAYWTGEQMSEWLKEEKYHENYFADIDNEITDRDRIKKLLNSSLLFGICSNNSYIMEITYTDGSVATVMVPAGTEGLR